MKGDFHARKGPVQEVGDFAVGKGLHVTEDENNPVRALQPPEGGADLMDIIIGVPGYARDDLSRRRRPALMAESVAVEIDGDAMQPSGEVSFAAKTTEPAIGAHESVLEEVLSLIRVAAQVEA